MGSLVHMNDCSNVDFSSLIISLLDLKKIVSKYLQISCPRNNNKCFFWKSDSFIMPRNNVLTKNGYNNVTPKDFNGTSWHKIKSSENISTVH